MSDREYSGISPETLAAIRSRAQELADAAPLPTEEQLVLLRRVFATHRENLRRHVA